MELKVGMYIRLDRCQGIAKIDEYDDDIKRFKLDKVIYDEYAEETFVLDESEVIKSSENIMDLIEENDLLSIEYYSPRYEERVTRLFEVDYRHNEYLRLKNTYCDFMLVNNEFRETDRSLNPIIKSVVTKEQFNSVKYEVE